MRGYFTYALLAVLLGTACGAPADGADGVEQRAPCGELCTLELASVCGYDGTCYKSYANKCAYDAEKCNGRNNLETVDMSLCELAEKDTHPNYKLCSS